MSFILDALRKSDARRRMGETPGLNSSSATGSPQSGQRRKRRAALLIGLAMAAILAVTLVLFLPSPISDRVQQWAGSAADNDAEVELSTPEPVTGAPLESGEESRQASERADRDERTIEQELARERIVSDPDQIDAELARRIAEETTAAPETKEPSESESPAARRERRGSPTPRTSVVAEAPTRTDRLAVDPRDTERMERLVRAREARLAEAEAGSRARTVGRESTAPTRSSEDPMESWSPSAAEYVRVWELPLSVRRNLPELRLSIHVFAAEEDQRFVLVNGERFITGDMISSSVRLVEIRREGAVVDYRDYRFLLEP